ncbi:MAG: hypothetical protein K9G70_07395 [Prolixibacteraceae bacterium]|nr:hypothetical protein [Prolixibacteraceae bacterium]
MKKNKITIGLLVLFFALIGFSATACEFDFEVLKGEKEAYNVGDEVIVLVTVTYTHRVCPEGIDATKFNFTGTKALGATKWEEVSNGKYERKLKLVITEDKKGIHILNAVRTCDKDGGSGTVDFKVG